MPPRDEFIDGSGANFAGNELETLSRLIPRRWQSGPIGWGLAVLSVAIAGGMSWIAGASPSRHWPLVFFLFAALVSSFRGWGPAILAAALAIFLVWVLFPTSLLQTKLGLELARDISGLIGAALTAAAFFNLERRKREAEKPKVVHTGDADLRKLLDHAGLHLDRKIIEPNDIDAQFTWCGLALISVSFAISIGLTLTAYFGVFGTAA
jgi:hypothetical protein